MDRGAWQATVGHRPWGRQELDMTEQHPLHSHDSWGVPMMANRSGTAAAKLLQSCPNLRDPIDDNPPASAVPGILQARILEWVAISFSN